jgi:malonyl-CoA O-methyltransferase
MILRPSLAVPAGVTATKLLLNMPDPVPLDKRRVRRNFARAAAGYDRAAVLSRVACARMLERLDLVRLAPLRILDAGSGTGTTARAVAHRYPRARITALDFCLPALRMQRGGGFWAEVLRAAMGRGAMNRVCADFERLPVRTGVMDLVISNLALHWSDAPEAAFSEMQRVLRGGGLLMFTTLGPDTLKELAQASANAGGRSPVHHLIDMHDLGDMLVRSGFADPVMDMEYLTLTYVRVDDLFRELRGSGALSARAGSVGLRTPRWRERLTQRYELLRREGRLPATFEIVYGHAWKPEQEDRRHGPGLRADGRAVIRLERPRRRD